MKTLRQVMQVIDPVNKEYQVKSVRELADRLRGCLRPPEFFYEQLISLREKLEEGSKYRQLLFTPLTFFWQNLALFPHSEYYHYPVSMGGIPIPDWAVKLFTGKNENKGKVYLYKGPNRLSTIKKLIEFLKENKPDIVGLCELWVPEERNQIINELGNIYPWNLQGPITTDLDQYKVEVQTPWYVDPVYTTPYLDGGLLLLSRHKIVDNNPYIYFPCKNEDCLTTKGILHARIEVSGHPTQYDIFITHMQSCPTLEPRVHSRSETATCEKTLQKYQAHQLSIFIQNHTSPERPALLMGDLNHNAIDIHQDGSWSPSQVYKQLKELLGYPEDLWETNGDGSMGITQDSNRIFESGQYRGPRHMNGSRYDYLFSWRRYNTLKPLYANTQVLVLQAEAFDLGKQVFYDISDHYGLMTHQTCLRELEIDTNQLINAVELVMKDFGSLEAYVGDFELTYSAASGAKDKKSGRTVALSLGDPGAWLDVRVHGKLMAKGRWGGGRQYSLDETFRFDRRELLMNRGQTVQRMLGYMAVQITVQ